MKNLFLIMLIVLITACGKKDAGSSIAARPVDNGPQEYAYEIRIEGIAGSSISSNLMVNFGDVDQTNYAVVETVDASQLYTDVFFGRDLFWQVQNTGPNILTVKVLKDGVEVKSEILNAGQIKNVTDNI